MILKDINDKIAKIMTYHWCSIDFGRKKERKKNAWNMYVNSRSLKRPRMFDSPKNLLWCKQNGHFLNMVLS